MIKDILVSTPPAGVASTLYVFREKIKVTKGPCITCENRPQCIWQENNKLYCEHFE